MSRLLSHHPGIQSRTLELVTIGFQDHAVGRTTKLLFRE